MPLDGLMSRARQLARMRSRRTAYRAAFGGGQGQEVLGDLMRRCGMDRLSFVPGEPETTAFNEGKRFVGQHIVKTLNLSEREIERLCQVEVQGED